jgi:hypothetical protein
MLTNITNTIIAITADSENGHEDAGQGELCAESWKRKTHFNTLGESGRVAGGRVETLYFSHRLHAERVEPFAEGLALGVELYGRRPRRTRSRRSAATALDLSLATACVLSAATTRGASAATTGFRLQQPHGFRLRRPHGFCLRQPHGFCLRRL